MNDHYHAALVYEMLAMAVTLALLLVLLGSCRSIARDFEQQLIVPVCKVQCENLQGNSLEQVVWARDEQGRQHCYAKPSSFSGIDAFKDCRATLNQDCEFTRIQLESENTGFRCENRVTLGLPNCVQVFQYEIDRGEWAMDRPTWQLPPKFPVCDITVNYPAGPGSQ